ncbi:MAG: hypothetical protein QF411_09655, partial [Planctomycetota bacterium]|nr:hypothetical protein [Planctomycetota bacterium]
SEPLAELTITTSDRDARWYDMDVTQEAAEAFTRWTWSLDPDHSANQQWFGLSSTKNLATLKLHSADAGIDTSVGAREIKVTLLLEDGDDPVQSDEVLLTGFAAEPTVDISGAELPIFGEDYDYDPLTGELRLLEHAWPDNGLIDWLINP